MLNISGEVSIDYDSSGSLWYRELLDKQATSQIQREMDSYGKSVTKKRFQGITMSCAISVLKKEKNSMYNWAPGPLRQNPISIWKQYIQLLRRYFSPQNCHILNSGGRLIPFTATKWQNFLDSVVWNQNDVFFCNVHGCTFSFFYFN